MICSRIPSEKLPRPSNDRGLRPRKSRIRGSAIETSRSRNSYIRSPRSVTRAPIGIPSRILKPAIDFLAAVRPAADADLLPAALDLADDDAGARRPSAGGAHDHHVRDLDRAGLLDHAARLDLRSAHPAGVAHRARPG